MSTIVMNRCDDRLIHGQVITGWMNLRNANTIWIIDDVVAKTPMMLDIFRFAAPPGIKLVAMTIDEAIERLKTIDQGSDRILMIAKRPGTFVRLMDAGYTPSDVNFGAMAKKPQSKTVGPNCDLDPQEMADTESLHTRGIRVWMQLVPFGGNKEVDWANVRGKFGYK